MMTDGRQERLGLLFACILKGIVGKKGVGVGGGCVSPFWHSIGRGSCLLLHVPLGLSHHLPLEGALSEEAR